MKKHLSFILLTLLSSTLFAQNKLSYQEFRSLVLQNHPLAKQVKDYAAGAVLVMSLWAILVFCLIAIPHLVMWLTLSN